MGDPPPPSTAAQLSFFAQPQLGEDLSLRVDCLRLRLFTFGGGLVASTLTKMTIIFLLLFLLAMSFQEYEEPVYSYSTYPGRR